MRTKVPKEEERMNLVVVATEKTSKGIKNPKNYMHRNFSLLKRCNPIFLVIIIS